jgi:DUF2917 family protein
VKIIREAFRIALEAGEMLRLESGRGIEVQCEFGRVWITEESDSRDLWLDAGERVRLAGRGLALLEAQNASRVRLLGA